MYEKVIIPTDGSDHSFHGVKEGLEAAKLYDIPALAVYVIRPSSLTEGGGRHRFDEFGTEAIDMMLKQKKKRGKKVLDEVRDIAADMDIDLEIKLVQGIPYEEITSLAGKDDIIYICSHGRSGLSSFFMGSTTDRVLKHTEATVAVVKPKNID